MTTPPVVLTISPVGTVCVMVVNTTQRESSVNDVSPDTIKTYLFLWITATYALVSSISIQIQIIFWYCTMETKLAFQHYCIVLLKLALVHCYFMYLKLALVHCYIMYLKLALLHCYFMYLKLALVHCYFVYLKLALVHCYFMYLKLALIYCYFMYLKLALVHCYIMYLKLALVHCYFMWFWYVVYQYVSRLFLWVAGCFGRSDGMFWIARAMQL